VGAHRANFMAENQKEGIAMGRNRSNAKGFVCGALFGGIVGGITALLFAPKSGEKLRKDVAKKYDEVSNKTQDFMEDVCDQTSELVEKAKDIACGAKEAASKMLKNKRKR